MDSVTLLLSVQMKNMTTDPKKEEVEEEEEVPEYVEEVNQPVSQTKTSQVQMQNAVDRD